MISGKTKLGHLAGDDGLALGQVPPGGRWVDRAGHIVQNSSHALAGRGDAGLEVFRLPGCQQPTWAMSRETDRPS